MTKKDENQRSLTEFFGNKPPENQQNESQKSEKNACSVLFKYKVDQDQYTALAIQIQKHKPMIIALVETWMKPEDDQISLLHDYYDIFERTRKNSSYIIINRTIVNQTFD